MSASLIVSSPADAFSLFADMADEPRERVALVCLDDRRGVIRVHAGLPMLARSTTLPVAALLRGALDCNASEMLVAHNHPGGDPMPSQQDIDATRQLCEAASAIGLRLLDHLVVASGGWRSFRLMGLL